MIKQLYMEIMSEKVGVFYIKACDEREETFFRYNPDTKELCFENDNKLTSFLKSNEYQFRRLLHNKRKNTFYTGFNLHFSIIDGKDIAAFNDKQNILVADHGKIYPQQIEKKKHLAEIFTDGSFSEKHAAGAYTFLIKQLDGSYTERSFVSESKNSSLIELEAVIAALTYFSDDVRIITDSQYVRKGITEWIVHWKLNNWTTANGTKAKHINQWKRLDDLCSHRYVEFAWIKAHSCHFENEYCDMQARQLAFRKNI